MGVSKLKWGVLGCGSFARRRSIPAMLQAPSVELLAVASRSAEQASEFQRQFHISRAYSSYEELLADTDIGAVHITLPNALHAPWTVRALESGKHVLCEKPLATTVEDAEMVSEQVRRSGLTVMEAFMWRFHPQHERAMTAVAGGEIGSVRLVRASFRYEIGDTNVRLHKDLGGGSVFDVGCYCVSAARFFANTAWPTTKSAPAIRTSQAMSQPMPIGTSSPHGLKATRTHSMRIQSKCKSSAANDEDFRGEARRSYAAASRIARFTRFRVNATL